MNDESSNQQARSPWRTFTDGLVWVAELVVILMIVAALLIVVARRDVLVSVVVGSQIGEHIAAEETTPKGILISLAEDLSRCSSSEVRRRDGNPRLRDAETSENFQGTFDKSYRTRVDDSKLARRLFPRNEGDSSPYMAGVLKSWSSCLAARAFGESDGSGSGILSDGKALDSRVHWVYLLLEHEGLHEFSIWPDSIIPSGFEPWERPWSFGNIQERHKEKFSFDHEWLSGDIYESHAYVDAFTRNHIVTLVLPFDVVHLSPEGAEHPVQLLAAVDIRLGNQSVYDRMLVLNFFFSFFLWGLSSFGRKSKMRFLKTWYRSWMVLAAFYAIQLITHLTGTSELIEGVPVLPFLSIVNTYFLLLTALYLSGRGHRDDGKISVIAVGNRWTFGVLLAAMISELLLGEIAFPVSPAEILESGFSLVALVMLGWTLRHVMLAAKPTDSKKLESVTVLGAGGIAALFFMQAALQVSIPFWPLSPFAEEIFWLMSIPMKVAEFLGFYIAIIFVQYWQRVRLNELFVDNLGKGIILADADFSVINANNIAEEMLGLPADFLKGQNLRDVLFRSEGEAGDVLSDFLQGQKVEDRKFVSNVHNSGPADLDDVTGVRRYVSCFSGHNEFGREPLVIVVITEKQDEDGVASPD